jgi:hypothetical protein
MDEERDFFRFEGMGIQILSSFLFTPRGLSCQFVSKNRWGRG